MNNKRNIAVLSFIFFIVVTGCSSHQQLDRNEEGIQVEAPRISAPEPAPEKTDSTLTKPSFKLEDEAGYKLRHLDIQIKAGKPYVPVGAELITSQGKVPLTRVLKNLSNLKGFSVSWADDVDQEKLVDCYIKAADNFYDALDNILRQLDYFYEIEEDTIIVKYKETKKYYISMPYLGETFTSSLGGNMLPDTGAEGGLSAQTKLVTDAEEFDFWKNIKDALDQIAKCDGCPPPVMDETLGMITISAPKRIHKDIERYLVSLKKEAYKQVIIEAKILEVSLTEDHNIGIDWENTLSQRTIGGNINLRPNLYTRHGPSGGSFLKSITITSPISWEVVVSAFKEYGDTKIISNPKIHLLNGHGAVLSAGQNLVYLSGCETTESDAGNRTASPETSSVTLGLTIGIKANVVNGEEVILYVFPALTRGILVNVGGLTDCGQIQAPHTFVREMATHAKVKDGEILIIGGLIQKAEEETTKKIPLLGDIPLLGRLFKHESTDNETTELVILLKTRILKPDEIIAKSIDW